MVDAKGPCVLVICASGERAGALEAGPTLLCCKSWWGVPCSAGQRSQRPVQSAACKAQRSSPAMPRAAELVDASKGYMQGGKLRAQVDLAYVQILDV